MRAVLLLTGAVVLLALVSCGTGTGTGTGTGGGRGWGGSDGGGGGGSPGGGGDPGPVPGQSCSIAPPSLVNAALGTSVGEPEFEDDMPGPIGLKHLWGCRYSDTVALGFGQGFDAAGMATLRKAYDDLASDGVTKVTEVSGVGDEALLLSHPKMGNTLTVRKGDRMVSVESDAPVEREKVLADKLFGRF